MQKAKRNLLDLIRELSDLSIKIGVQDGNLRVSAPKGAITPRLRDELVTRKEELIDFYQGPVLPANHEESIRPVDRSDWSVVPLSYSQEGLWFLEKLNPGEATYHIPMGVEFLGDVRPEILIESIRWLMKRHESLRTAFHESENLPYPVVETNVKVPFSEVDLTKLEQGDRELDWGKILRHFLHDPFDLAAPPLFRAILIKLEPQRSQLILNLHHMIADGWSLGILMEELGEAYDAFLSGFMPDNPPLRYQFVDYAAWQKTRFGMKGAQKPALDYWKDHLSGAPQIINLPTDRPRLKDANVSGGIINFRVNSEIAAGIHQLAKREHVTPFMVLIGAFYVLLYRYSRQTDIIVGTPVANRPYEDLEGIVGFFANTIALRSEIDPELSFSEYLKRIRQIALEGFDHQEIPFEMVVDHLQPDRSNSWNPLYQVMFALQNNQMEWPEVSDLKTRFLNHFAMENSRLDLFFEMWEDGDQLVGQVEYNDHLFEVTSIRRMVSHYVTLLNGVVRVPGTALSDLPLMLPDERNQIVLDWNKTDFPFPDEAMVHELFELQVRRTGDQTALIDVENNVSLTWAELNQKANRLAHYLQSIGIKQNSIVGISMPRSAEMIVTLFGILKAGAGWLPLDVEYPADRLQYMVEDAKPEAIVVESAEPDWLDKYYGRLIPLNIVQNEIEVQPASNLPAIGDSENRMYILYTSGSTGKAKGVVGHHRGAINRFSWMWNKYPFEPNEVAAQKTTLNFVDSVWEIFGPLLKGVPLVIVPEKIVADPEHFIPFLAKHMVSRLVLVPSLLEVILARFKNLSELLPDLKIWTTSGESLSVDLYNRFSRVNPDAVLLNIYGSSEVAADVTYIDTTQYPTSDRMYIGKPIDNMRVYLLDERLEPVPVGIPGEICVAGPGVAHGYHNQPQLTAERFIPDPITGIGTMFKTGDIGRFNGDGQIEFLGRSDFQLKIRGVRIEPGEIEHTLISHLQIREVIVGSWSASKGQPELVAWFKLDRGVTVSPEISELRAFLSQRLPTYMVPSRFVNLPEFPLTPNGKIDRNRLPAPTLDIYRTELPYTPPRDDVEEELVTIWKQVLVLHKISIFDDFFELGGQSILAVQMFGRIRDHFHVDLNLSQLFQTSTIAELADIIRKQKQSSPTHYETHPSIPTISRENISDDELYFEHLVKINEGQRHKRPIFCVHGAGGNVLFFQKWKKYLGDLPFWSFQARGIDGIAAPHESIVEMASAYIQEMLRVEPEGPWILGGYSGGGVVALEMAIQLQAIGYEAPPIVMIDTFHPGVRARNYTMRDRVHLLTTNPVDYVKSVAKKRIVSSLVKEYSREELDEMMADGTPLPIELRDDYMTDQFAKLLELYDDPVPYAGKVLLLCAEEIWQMFSHAGYERGWKGVLTDLEVREVPGDHFSLIEEPSVAELIKQLKTGVEKFS